MSKRNEFLLLSIYDILFFSLMIFFYDYQQIYYKDLLPQKKILYYLSIIFLSFSIILVLFTLVNVAKRSIIVSYIGSKLFYFTLNVIFLTIYFWVHIQDINFSNADFLDYFFYIFTLTFFLLYFSFTLRQIVQVRNGDYNVL